MFATVGPHSQAMQKFSRIVNTAADDPDLYQHLVGQFVSGELLQTKLLGRQDDLMVYSVNRCCW